jgi:hypothetical protein
VGVGWSAVAAVLVWPHGLCYSNELWGSWRDGYRLASDSNYDWGQGLKELAQWQQQRGVEGLDLWYFGSDPQLGQLPMRAQPLHVMPFEKPEDVASQLAGRYLAVSTTMLYGQTSDPPADAVVKAALARRQPVARTTTYLIYDFTRDQHRAISPAPSSRAQPR